MRELLSTAYNKAEEYKGRNLLKLLLIIFVIFIVIGLAVGYVVGNLSPEPEIVHETVEEAAKDSFEGTITYIEPLLNPGDDITYALIDKGGKEIILLKADDQKLNVSEGHIATVFGKMKKTVTGKDYLLVEKVVIRNAAN